MPAVDDRFKRWIAGLLEKEGQTLEHLNFIFCTDKFLYSLNIRYLSHDSLTDVISFDNSIGSGKIEGDIFISITRVRANALKYGVTYRSELMRVMAHGVLHLCGYNDKEEAEIKQMRRKEEEALHLAEEYIP